MTFVGSGGPITPLGNEKSKKLFPVYSPLILMPIYLVKTEQIDRRQHQIEIGELVNEESELAIP